MRTIRWSSRFKRDLRQALKQARYNDVDNLVERVSNLLSQGEPLDARFRRHTLLGKWRGHEECHLYPDLLLIFLQVGEDEIWLVRLGSHSELFIK